MEYIELTRGKEKIAVGFRPATEIDASAIVECIRDEYGETYFKRDFYDEKKIIEENARGHIRFFVVETDDGDIAGIIVLKRFLPHEEMCEIASEIFRKKYRGFGIAYHCFLYVEEMIRRIDEKEPVSAIYCLPVLFHDVTERLMERLGLVPTGFVFGKFRLSVISHSYGVIDAPKHHQGIMIKKLSRSSAGTVYLPQEHRDIATKIYRALGADFFFGEEEGKGAEKSEIRVEHDETQRNCIIYVDSAGLDLSAKITAIHKQYFEEESTFSVFLNISEPAAVSAYRTLCRLGYFFAGFQPLCSSREVMVLHNPMGVPLSLGTLVLTPSFAELLKYVAAFLHEGDTL